MVWQDTSIAITQFIYAQYAYEDIPEGDNSLCPYQRYIFNESHAVYIWLIVNKLASIGSIMRSFGFIGTFMIRMLC